MKQWKRNEYVSKASNVNLMSQDSRRLGVDPGGSWKFCLVTDTYRNITVRVF